MRYSLRNKQLCVITLLCVLMEIVNISDCICCIIAPREYMLGAESMVFNGGIKYKSMMLYILSDTLQLITIIIMCWALFQKKHKLVVITLCVYFSIMLIFSKHGLILFI